MPDETRYRSVPPFVHLTTERVVVYPGATRDTSGGAATYNRGTRALSRADSTKKDPMSSEPDTGAVRHVVQRALPRCKS